jgi:hypothetical protein
LTLDVYGAGVGNVCVRPEVTLRDYDVVFAKGRAALEAAATGAAVIVYWWRRLGPMVNTNDLDRLRTDGFGIRLMSPQLSPEEFGRAIEQALEEYDPEDAAEVSRRVRASAGRDVAVSKLLELYEEVISEYAATQPDRESEGRAAATHVRNISLSFSQQRAAIFNSTTLRFAEKLRQTPGIGKLVRAVARGVVARGKPS